MIIWAADFTYQGTVEWQSAVSFVVRAVCSEYTRIMPTEKYYQKCLVWCWVASYFIIVSSYAGNLTAMIMKPRLNMPVRNIEQLLGQTEIPWVVETGFGVTDYMASFPQGSNMKKLINGATLLEYPFLWGCLKEELLHSHASICDDVSIKSIFDGYYSKLGKCDHYLTDNKWYFRPSMMAFPVGNTQQLKTELVTKINTYDFRKEVQSCKRPIK